MPTVLQRVARLAAHRVALPLPTGRSSKKVTFAFPLSDNTLGVLKTPGRLHGEARTVVRAHHLQKHQASTLVAPSKVPRRTATEQEHAAHGPSNGEWPTVNRVLTPKFFY